MDKIKKFFSKLGYTDVFDKLNDEDADIDEVISAFQDEYRQVVETEVKKTFKTSNQVNEDEIYKKIKNSLFQKFKTGLNLAEVGNVKDYEDEKEFIAAVQKEVESREKQGDEAIKQKYESLVAKHNEHLTEFEKIQNQLSAKENEFDTYKTTLQNQLQTKTKYDSLFDSFKFGVSDVIKNDYKKIWWDQLNDNFKVDPETGAITDKDGGFVVIDKRKVDTINDWLKINVESRGLEMKNNGKPTGGFQSGGTSGSDSAELREWEANARKAGVSEDTIKTYMENRKPAPKPEPKPA